MEEAAFGRGLDVAGVAVGAQGGDDVLNGLHAFAIFDDDNVRLLGARDRTADQDPAVFLADLGATGKFCTVTRASAARRESRCRPLGFCSDSSSYFRRQSV